MDISCLNHCMTIDERTKFERDGFLVVRDAMPPNMVADFTEMVETIEPGVNCVGKHDLFLELIDLPTILPKVWDILSWNIHLYHTHYSPKPPLPPEERDKKNRLHWHQDSGRVTLDMESIPAPRVSVKVGFFLSDLTKGGHGNFNVIPGSHLKDEIEFPPDGVSNPEGALEVLAAPGTAVFFDRRLWHDGGRNCSETTRKAIFLGYSFRWFRTRDAMTVSHYMDRVDPIRRQLLGAHAGAAGFTLPTDEDVPLRGWLQEHLGEEAVANM